MPKDRGDYDTFYRSMPDSEEFEVLSIEAASVLGWGLKLARENNITGIFQLSRDVTAHRAKITIDRLDAALDELERERWIVRERSWIWIRNQLRFDPSFAPTNERQVKGLFTQLDGLPRLRIVAAFVRYYQRLGYLPGDLVAWKPHRREKNGELVPDADAGRRATSSTIDLLERFPQVTIDTLPSLYKAIDRLSIPLTPGTVTGTVTGTPTGTVTGTTRAHERGAADSLLPDPVAAWRVADGRTIPQLAEAVIAFQRGLADETTTAEACASWCAYNGAPDDLIEPITAAMEKALALGAGYDDLGEPGAHESLIADGEPLVKFISEREGLDATEVVSEASAFNGHSYLSLRQIPTNRHKRLTHTVNALRRWARRLRGDPEPAARAAPNARKSVGEKTADTVKRMIARRTANAAAIEGRAEGGEVHGGAGEAGRGLPPGDGRRDG
jgi:hypothetical protein